MVMCFCGSMAVVRTAWTDNNPGRRFWGCPHPNSQCGFIGWIDGPMCPRSKAIIPGLLRSLNRHQKIVEDMRAEATKLKCYLFCSWFFFVIVVLFMM
ncbi:hypothetical protein LXL04_022115 [Taraxacum kok-saghyz]